MEKYIVIYRQGNEILESREELETDAKQAASTYSNVIAVLPAEIYYGLPEGLLTSHKCECGNVREQDELQCAECDAAEYEEQHVGHLPRFGGGWYCDTCDSPYCELA